MSTAVQQQTAILFFSRSPQEEVDAKQLTFRRSRAAVRLLLEHSLRQARKTQLPLYTCYTAQQRGTNFGERLANALEDVYAAGHERVVIIGNDSPGLHARHIRKAEEQLRNGQLVLGPATDGGVYLIGLNRNSYDRHRFLSLAWETATLQATWEGYVEALDLRATTLPELADLDSSVDFWRYLRCGKRGLLVRRLCVCLLVCVRQIIASEPALLYPSARAISPYPQRGPPVLL